MSRRVEPKPPRLRREATAGGPQAVNVLLLHGMGAGPSTWDALAGELAQHLALWDATLPWSLAGDPGWATDPDARQWVQHPIDHIRLSIGRNPDIVLAHSFAANLLLELLVEVPAAAPDGAVLVAPFYRPRGEQIDWLSVTPGMTACYAKAAERVKLRDPADDKIGEAVVRRLLEAMGEHTPLRFYETCRRTPRLDLESVRIPILLIGGDHDEYGAHPDGIQALGARFSRARVEILPGCGHFPMTQRAGEFAALLHQFIDRAVHSASSVPEEAKP